MLGRILALIVKELLAVLKDPKSRAVVFAIPVIQMVVFPYAATFDVRNITTAVWSQDEGSAGRDLIARFAAAEAFGRVYRLDGQPAIGDAIATRRADLAIQIGQDFSADLAAGRPAVVQLIVDGSNSNTALITLNYALDIVGRFADARGPDAPAVLVDRAFYNPNLESRWFIVPGLLGILTLIATLATTAFSVAREKETGTFEQLLVTPLRPLEILIGKTVPGLLIGLVQGAIILALAIGWYRVPMTGSLALLAGGLVVFLTAVIGLGLAVSAVARTQQQALFGAFLLNVPMVILSGFATPIENMPDWIQTLTLANPLRWFTELSRAVMLKDLPADAALALIWPMAAIAVVTLGAATWLFRRRLY
jgi:ABC-2 type transport system permease protein